MNIRHLMPRNKQMMTSKKILQLLSVAGLAVAFTLPAFGQQPEFPGAEEQPDEVDQLAQMVGLSDDQQTEIREVIAEISPKIEELQVKAQEAQEELHGKAGKDFDEDEIRKGAAKLGEMTGEITALSIILQSRVDGIFTDDQRDQLDQLQQQQQQQQQQMQQQQMQQQLEQQMQQQEGQAPQAPQPQP